MNVIRNQIQVWEVLSATDDGFDLIEEFKWDVKFVKSLTKIQVDTKFGKINSVEHAVHYVIIFHLMEIISRIIGHENGKWKWVIPVMY